MNKEEAEKMAKLLDEAVGGPWELAKGGRSINTGDGGKIRMESNPKTEATMRFIVAMYEFTCGEVNRWM